MSDYLDSRKKKPAAPKQKSNVDQDDGEGSESGQDDAQLSPDERNFAEQAFIDDAEDNSNDANRSKVIEYDCQYFLHLLTCSWLGI